MVLRVVLQQITGRDIACLLSFCRSAHALPLPTPVNHSIDTLTVLLRFSLLQNELSSESSIGFQLPHFSFGGGSMELMAVPKRKVSPHKRGMRNGPKALKPIPMIICCKNCGAVRLPHFYCCGGRKEGPIEKGIQVGF